MEDKDTPTTSEDVEGHAMGSPTKESPTKERNDDDFEAHGLGAPTKERPTKE